MASSAGGESSGGSPALGWAGLGMLGTLWVFAHWRVAAFLDRLDRTWDPPSFLETVERGFLVAVGVVASVVLVAGVQALFRKLLARSLRSVAPRVQVLVFVVPVLVCLVASWRFRVMLTGPLLLLGLNAVQFARGLPPSTPAVEALGWFGRTGAKVGRASWKVAGRGARAARARLDRPDSDAPPF
jgi:hypothetical protein